MKNIDTTIVYGNRAKAQAESALSSEFVIDMVNRLPKEGRPGTSLGFMMGLGLSNPDTEFRAMKRPARVRDGLITGAYFPEGEKHEAANKYLEGLINSGDMITPYEGEEDVAYFTPQFVLERRGLADRLSETGTVAHELFHKGSVLAMPIIDDMLKEKAGPIGLLSLQKEKLKQFKESFKKDANHSKYLKAMNKYYLVNGDTSKLTKEEKASIADVRIISGAIDRYLTEGRKEKYGIRTPTKTTRPKKKGMFEKFFK